MDDTKALQTIDELFALDTPKSFDKNDLTGSEMVEGEEIRLPRLLIAQQMSDQMTPGKMDYMPDLKPFEFFNEMTGEIYGKGPLVFVPVAKAIRRIEFDPENRGVPLDLNVPVHDIRNEFTTVDGKRVPPKATKFFEFMSLLVRTGKPPVPIAISVKTTNKWNRKAAEKFWQKLTSEPRAIYSEVYEVESMPQSNAKGTFGCYNFRPYMKQGRHVKVNTDTPAGRALYEGAKKFAQMIKNAKEVFVTRDDGVDDADEAGGVKSG
jgi:hypothetical protein